MARFQYNVGDIIEYTAFGGDIRRVEVTYKDDNIKNGRAGFDATSASGFECWGYDTQIIRVVVPARG